MNDLFKCYKIIRFPYFFLFREILYIGNYTPFLIISLLFLVISYIFSHLSQSVDLHFSLVVCVADLRHWLCVTDSASLTLRHWLCVAASLTLRHWLCVAARHWLCVTDSASPTLRHWLCVTDSASPILRRRTSPMRRRRKRPKRKVTHASPHRRRSSLTLTLSWTAPIWIELFIIH